MCTFLRSRQSVTPATSQSRGWLVVSTLCDRNPFLGRRGLVSGCHHASKRTGLQQRRSLMTPNQWRFDYTVSDRMHTRAKRAHTPRACVYRTTAGTACWRWIFSFVFNSWNAKHSTSYRCVGEIRITRSLDHSRNFFPGAAFV